MNVLTRIAITKFDFVIVFSEDKTPVEILILAKLLSTSAFVKGEFFMVALGSATTLDCRKVMLAINFLY